MSKLVTTVLVAIAAVIALVPRGTAADLQAGWYANVYLTYIYIPGPEGPQLLSGAYFYDTPPGQYGPFLVTDGPYHGDGWREVSVPSSVYEVGPNQSLVMPLYMPMVQGDRIAYVGISWETNYDPTQMRLELWRRRYGGGEELVFSQGLSGLRFGSGNVAYDSVYEGPWHWRVAVIPEPSSASSLVGFVGVVFAFLLRRRR